MLCVAQDFHCSICGTKFTQACQRTLDHTFSKRYSWTNNGNVTVAHYDCNHKKGSADPTGCDLIWLQVANTALVLHQYHDSDLAFWTYFDQNSQKVIGY